MTPPYSNIPLWEDGAWQALSELRGEEEADVCVVGLGGSGLACLSELHALGVGAVGIDAGSVAGGASGRNGGFLRAGLSLFHHEAVGTLGRERAARVYRLTMEERERMLAETPGVIRRAGYLRRAADAGEERDCRAQLQAMLADALPAEWYDGPGGRGVLVRDDAACNPLARCRALARRLMASGVRLCERSRAVGIAGTRVDTEAGRVRCRAVVVAVDGGLGALIPELAGEVRAARLQMLGTAPTIAGPFPFAVAARNGWDYWQQVPSGSVAIGGCRDVAMDDEWTDAAAPTPRVQDALERMLRDDLAIAEPITHRWAANVSYTQDAWPVLREVRPRVWVCGAYSGTGNLVGAAAGRAAAHLAVGRSVGNPFA